MQRKPRDLATLTPQGWLDYARESGAATAVVDALFEEPVWTHWQRMLALVFVRTIAAERGWVRIAASAQLWLIYEYGFVTGALAVQKQVSRHFEAAGLEIGVTAILEWHLQETLLGQVYLPTVAPIAIKPVQGARIASTRIDTPRWTDEELAEVLPGLIDRLEARYLREHPRRPQWEKDLLKLMRGDVSGVSVRTLQRYLQVNPGLREYLDAARARVAKEQIRVA